MAYWIRAFHNPHSQKSFEVTSDETNLPRLRARIAKLKKNPSGRMRAFTCTRMAWTASMTGSIQVLICGRSKRADARGRDGDIANRLAARELRRVSALHPKAAV
jgi:hypothetical protein